jgi:ribosomal protein S18 acetylase RimI-like enzyme
MAVLIREATAQDCDNLCELIGEVDALHRENLPHMFKRPAGPARDRDLLLGLIENRSVGLFIAEVKGEVAGFVNVVLRDAAPLPIFVPRRFAVVDNLAVKKKFQRSGVGQALMAEAERWAKYNGAIEIELNVYEFNEEAIAFYERLGYETFSRRMSKVLR